MWDLDEFVRGREVSRQKIQVENRLFVRPLHLEGQAENPAATNFRLRRRGWRGLGLRRQWLWRSRGQILALHRIHQFTVRSTADRRAMVDARSRALGRQFRLRPCGRGNQENCKDELLHRFFSCKAISRATRAGRALLNRIGGEKSNEVVTTWHSSTAARRPRPRLLAAPNRPRANFLDFIGR
jgi:hypothetical protein